MAPNEEDNDAHTITAAIPSQRGPELANDGSSITDSGYGRSRQSLVTTDASSVVDALDNRLLIRTGSLPFRDHSNLSHFIKPLDEATAQRFNEIIPVVEELLLPILSPSRTPRCLAIRRMFLGRSEVDVTAHIVILCKKKFFKRVENAVNTSAVRDLCELPGAPRLKILVTEHEPRLTATKSTIEVHRNKATTLCGTPILLLNKSEETHDGDTRKATVGGIIKIKAADGTFKLYGMTSGHVIDDWQSTPRGSGENDGAETSDTLSASNSDEPTPSTTRQSELGSQDILSDAWDFADSHAFAEIFDRKKFAAYAEQDVQPCYDWALFTARSSMPNELCALKYPGCFERRELKATAKPTFHDRLSEPVVMMGGSRGPLRGELSSLMSRILIGSSGAFVDAYMMTPNEKYGKPLWSKYCGYPN